MSHSEFEGEITGVFDTFLFFETFVVMSLFGVTAVTAMYSFEHPVTFFPSLALGWMLGGTIIAILISWMLNHRRKIEDARN